MPKNKQLQKQIEKKLATLSKLLDNLEKAHIINSDDPETWDSDALYDLAANLKEALALLEDQESPQEKDNFGNPLILEAGLCSSVDEYQSEEEEEEDF